MIHVIIGTRAQLIKMLPLMRAMQQAGWHYNFVFLAQHKATILEMLDDFGLKHPDYVIADDGMDIVSSRQMVWWSIRALVEGVWRRKRIFKGDRRGVALVHGDAPPLFLGALIAKSQGLRVAQIEAGLRSFDYRRPFPEEVTRVWTARLGLVDLHFCQSEAALQNAQAYPGRKILTHGNTIADTLAMVGESSVPEKMAPYGLVSLHRYETLTDPQRLRWIVAKLQEISTRVPLRFVLHPPTEAALCRGGLFELLDAAADIQLLPRMTFMAFQQALAHAQFLISDGGSNQEESAYLGIPCLLFRERSERDEGLGRNVVLSNFDVQVIDRFVADPSLYRVRTPLEAGSPTQIILRELAVFAPPGGKLQDDDTQVV